MINRVEINIGNRKIAGDHFKCNGRRDSIVILLHGFLSSKESMYSIAEALQSANIDSLAIDFNGHGGSEEDFSEFTVTKAINDCTAAIDFARGLDYSKIGLFGFSIGGFIVLNVLKSYSKSNISAAALGSPLSNFSAVFDASDINEWKRSNILKTPHLGLNIRLNYRFYEDGKSHDGYNSYSSISTPILIIHGTSDRIVPISQSEELIKHLPNAHLFKINGGGHNTFYKNGAECKDALIRWFSSKF